MASHRRQMKEGIEGSVEFCRIWATMGKGRNKQALRGTRAEYPRQEIGELDAKDTCSIIERTDQRWEKLFKGIAIGKNETSDPFCMVCNYQLTNGPPSLIADPD